MSDVNQAVLTTGLILLLANGHFIRLIDVRIGRWRWGAKALLLVIAGAVAAASFSVVATMLAAVSRLLP